MSNPLEAVTAVIFPPAIPGILASNMSGGGGGPAVPGAAPTAPNPDDADTRARLLAAQARERGRKRSAGSILTSPQGVLGAAPVAQKSLLGN